MSKDFSNVYDDMKWRGAISNATPGARDMLISKKVTMYIGFDPTSASLHIGNLVPIVSLARMQRYGHSPIALVGGGTGMIGDPSGKDKERSLLSKEDIDKNLEAIQRQMENFLDFETKENPAKIINNADWLRSTYLIDFLRDVGKHFTVNSMLSREVVKNRLEKGISVTEFSYQLLQAYDYLQLFDTHGCTFQGGGSDQWGNILSGVDLIRKTRSAETHAMVYPLITRASGEKFAKSTGGVPTLNPADTSPYNLYQFFYNSTDEDTILYLKFFTFLNKKEIEDMEEAIRLEPYKRTAQRILAEEVTRMIHGGEGLKQAKLQTDVYFGGDIGAEAIASAARDAVSINSYNLSEFNTLAELIGKLFPSTATVKRLARQGGLNINGVPISEDALFIKPTTANFPFEASDGRMFMVVRQGKKIFKVLMLHKNNTQSQGIECE